MAKFNLSNIKGIDKMSEQKANPIGAGVSVGSGLLNEGSLQLKEDIVKVIYIPREQIIKNEKNNYSIEEIPSLAESIKAYGLAQPLNVFQKEEGNYKVTGGERRLTAIDLLIERGEWKTDIPCIVKDPKSIKLPLTDENKEKYAIITVNREGRTYTDKDIRTEIQDWKNIIEELRGKNVDYMPGGEDIETGEGKSVKIKGVSTRDIIAEQLGVSPSTVAQFNRLENAGSEAVKKAVEEDRLTIKTATEVVKMDPKEQNEFIDKMNQEKPGQLISPSDVKIFGREKEGKVLKTEEGIHGNYTISSTQFKKDIKVILKNLKEKNIMLEKVGYEEYLKAISNLEKLLHE